MTSTAQKSLGISQRGIDAAMSIKRAYRAQQPLVMPGHVERLLVPETLLNREINLSDYEDPLALAMVSARDPEGSMALAATARLCPLGNDTELVRGVIEIIGDTSKHELVRECLKYVSDHAFAPESIAKVHSHAGTIVSENRRRFTAALRENLRSLLDGDVSPRVFVRDFFELTEAGNLRHDVRKKLVLSLLLSSSVRPSIKFLLLENFHRLPKPVQLGIVAAVLKAEPSRHTDIIKEELNYILLQARASEEGHDVNGRPAPGPELVDTHDFPNPSEHELHPEEPTPWFLI